MMMMPSIFKNDFFGEDLFDNRMNAFSAFKNFFKDDFFQSDKAMMKTDVKEKDGVYHIDMELPGVNKEDVKVQLKNGYLTVLASNSNNQDEKDEDGNYIRKERYSGQFARSFYVGDHLKQEDIKAKYENGVLLLTIPKDTAQIGEKGSYIAIEG